MPVTPTVTFNEVDVTKRMRENRSGADTKCLKHPVFSEQRFYFFDKKEFLFFELGSRPHDKVIGSRRDVISRVDCMNV